MGRDLDENERARIESYIDAAGIDAVLMAISEICGLKSEHIAHHWQDVALAKRWARLEGAVGVIVPDAEGL
jgi:hypothetical protein